MPVPKMNIENFDIFSNHEARTIFRLWPSPGGRPSGKGGETRGVGDAGLNRVRYRYRLLPHVFAIEHAGWCGVGYGGS